MPSPRFELTRREEFCCAYRLHEPELTDAENRELYGVCNNPNGHGHNFELEVTVRGPVPARTGMVMDLLQLSRLVREEIVEPIDHKHLNLDVEFLAGVNPTAENLAVVFWERLARRFEGVAAFEGVELARIRLSESRGSALDYFGPMS